MDFKQKLKDSVRSDASKGQSSKQKEALEDDYIYAPVTTEQPLPHHQDRTLFVVDLSRLKAERDTLENALVIYRPEREFKKPQYEQRCSQLVGLSLCTMNFTGKYPEFLRLKGTGYAVRGLGEHYVMGLSSRIEEPSAYCVNYLKNIHDMFRFYYHTPSVVYKAAKDDWDKFKEMMSSHINGILDYILRDQHSVPAMLNPLPYIKTNPNKKKSSRNFLLASRILKACQHHTSVVGGTLTHNQGLVMSQFSPEVTEKLLLVGGGAVSLDHMSVLGDNIAPGKVWVLEVFLTGEEESLICDTLKDHSGLKTAYSSLDRAAHTTLTQMQASKTSALRTKGHWRRQANNYTVGSASHTDGGFQSTPRSGKPPPLQASSSPVTCTPIAIVGDDNKLSPTNRSEDAIVISPNMSTVFFDTTSLEAQHRHSSSSSAKQDMDESEYVDAVETMDSTVEVSKGAAGGPSSPAKAIPIRRKDSDGVFEDARPGSVSSEVFATPSPSPPREPKTQDVGIKEKDDDTLTRDHMQDNDPATLTNEELSKLINTPVFLDSTEQEASITAVRSANRTSMIMALPPSWKFKPTTDSDCDDDFVDSETLDKMLHAAGSKKTDGGYDFIDSSDMAQNSRNEKGDLKQPPPLPPRNLPNARSRPRPLQVGSPVAPPPLPPRNYTLARNAELPELDSPSLRRSIYDTLSRDASFDPPTDTGELANEIEDEESTPIPVITPDPDTEGALVPNSSDTPELLEELPLEQTDQSNEGTIDQSIGIYADSPKLTNRKAVVSEDQNGEDVNFQDSCANDDSVVRSKTMSIVSTKNRIDPNEVSIDPSEVSIDPSEVSIDPSEVSIDPSEVSIDPSGSSVNQVSQSLYLDSSYEYIPDGMVTPPGETSFIAPESLVNGLPMKFRQLRQKLKAAPMLPPRNAPTKLTRSKVSDDELSDPDESSDEDIGILEGGGNWIPPTTIKRPPSSSDKDPYVVKRCLYVQQYMGTEVMLVGSENLHKNHSVLNSLWRSLLPQLMELDNALRRDAPGPPPRSEVRPSSSVVTYSRLDHSCEAVPHTTAYHFRHALRRIHHEYNKDPSLMQVSLSKEHLRVLSQHVHEREVYLQPSRMGHLDVLAMHGQVEKYAKTKTSLRQQPTGGPKIMFV